MKVFYTKMAILIAVIMATVNIASAHEIVGKIGRKSSKKGGVDQFTVSCFNDGNGAPSRLSVEVTDRVPRNPSKVRIQIVLPSSGKSSKISTDSIDGDGVSSPKIDLAGGEGPYLVIVRKSASRKRGAEIYLADFHCEAANDVHTGTEEPVLTKDE